jgi:hypothetical protein
MLHLKKQSEIMKIKICPICKKQFETVQVKGVILSKVENEINQVSKLTYCSEKCAYISKIRKQRLRRIKDKIEVLKHYGGECVCCGELEVRFLTIDHIEGGGTKQRKEIGKGNFYQWLKNNNFPDGFQIMCSNCNTAKGQSKVQFCPVHHPELYMEIVP